jgi:RNA polymerase sigma-70 factor (ECF subfamily)
VLPVGLEPLPEFAGPLAEGAEAVAEATGVHDSAGPAVSWREVYHRHFDDIHRLVYRCGVPAAEVDDVTQTVFLRALQRTDRLRRPGAPGYNLRAWLYGIALRVVSEHRRWARVRRLKAWVLENTVGAASPSPATPEDASAAGETRRRVGAVLGRMSAKLSDVLVLRDIDERSLEETAVILSIPENTVRSRLRLARLKFEELWNEPPGSLASDGKERGPT